MNEQRMKQAIQCFRDALCNLEEEIATYENTKKSRNSALLTFILAFEAFWKALKILLYQREGIDVASPKGVLQNAFQQGWLGQNDTIWMDMSDDRNLISHTYSEDRAIQIYAQVEHYAVAMRATCDFLKEKHPTLFV